MAKQVNSRYGLKFSCLNANVLWGYAINCVTFLYKKGDIFVIKGIDL
jgi:hypothetical protein